MAAMGFRAAMDALTAHLRDNELSAALDVADLNLPAVWVELASAAPDAMDGNGTITVNLNCIVGNVAYPDAIKLLDELVADVVALVDTEGDIVPRAVIMPDQRQPLPSLRVQTLIPYTRSE